MNITLRQRLEGKKISLYLDIYSNGVRKCEYLKLYLKKEPAERKLNSEEKCENKRVLMLAESIRVKRLHDLQNNRYGIIQIAESTKKFTEYAESILEKSNYNKSAQDINRSLIKHLKSYDLLTLQVRDVNTRYLDGFKNYLKNYKIPGSEKQLSINTQSIYFQRLKYVVSEACKNGVILYNLNSTVSNIKGEETAKEYLTLEEIQQLMRTKVKDSKLKNMFLFMCLTGLRFSDTAALKHNQIVNDSNGNKVIRFRQQKTKGISNLPISNHAYDLIKLSTFENENVFPYVNYSSSLNKKLKEIIVTAGIEKEISFHSARHTFATLSLTFGSDIYTVSKLLGHKSVKTTEVYAKIIDSKKVEAVSKIAI